MTVACPCGVAFERVRQAAGRPTVYCDSCQRERARQRANLWYLENRQRAAAAKRSWAEAHPDETRRHARDWAKRNRVTVKMNSHNYEARKRGAFVERVDPRALYEIDAGICGICGELCSAESFEVDHIVPLSKGGEHSYVNTQIAHATCNRRKNARLATAGVTP